MVAEQMAEARRTEVAASHNFKMRQQFLEDELKFNAQDLEATEHFLDEAQGQLTTDTVDLKMTEDALARDCQAKAVEFETATNGRSEELDAYAKARAVISQKTGGAELFSYGLTQTSFPQLSRSMMSSRGGLAKFGAVRKIRELAKSEHSFELARLASRVASAMHAETSTGDLNMHAQHVVNVVEVEKPKTIELAVQRKKLIIQEKIKQGTKPIEFPLAQFLDKAGNMPVVAQRQASMAQTVQKDVEVPLPQFTDKVVDIPVVAQRQIFTVQTVQTSIEIPQLPVVDVPVVLVMQDPLVQVMAEAAETPQLQIPDKMIDVPVVSVVKKTVEIPQLPFMEKINEIPEIRTVRDAQTSESLSIDSEVLFRVNRQSPDIAGGVRVDRDDLRAMSAAAEAQQQHKSSKHQPTKKSTRQERGRERKEEERREQEGRKEEEKEAEDGGEQVEKDVTGWTEVTRNKRKKMVQIFVKVDGMKMVAMEVSPEDNVQKILKTVSGSDQDVYVTSGGRILRRDEKLKSCEVTDGCTVEVTSRTRGGGKHKDKKGKEEKKKQAQLDDGMCAMACEQMRQVLENLKTVADNSTGEDKRRVVENVEELRKAIIGLRKQARGEELQRVAELEESLRKLEEEMILWSFEEQEQRWQEEQTWYGEQEEQEHAAMTKGKGKGNGGKGEHASGKGKFGGKGTVKMVNGDDQGEEADKEKGGTRNLRWADCEEEEGEGQGAAEGEWYKSRKEQSIMWLNGSDEEREGHGGSTGGERCEVCGRVEVWSEESEEQEERGGQGGEGARQKMPSEEDEEDERTVVAPNTGAGGSHPRATTDPEEEVKAEELTGKEKADEKPPGLEEVKSEQEVREDEERRKQEAQEERRAHEARGEEKRRAQEAREEEKRAQEAREEEKRAQEAREEEKRAQEAREEEKRAQEAREEEKRAQEAREEEKRAQEVREEEKRAQEAREEQRRAQEAREEERRAQEAREEEKRAQEAREEERRAQEAREEQRRAQEAREEQRRAQEAPELRRSVREVSAQEERTEQERKVEAQGGQEEDVNSVHDKCHVSNRHMTWWHNAWWIRVDNGPHMRSARGRRRTWRAARQAAEQVRDGNWVGETWWEDRERLKKGERGEERQHRKSNEATLHLILHVSQQQQQQQSQQLQ